MAEQKKPTTIFTKMLTAGEAQLDRIISKARSEIAENEDEAFWRKSVYRDVNFSSGSQGWAEKGNRIGFGHLKHMAMKDTIVASIIQTYQNLVAKHSKAVKETSEIGFRITRKNEEKALREIMEELFGKPEDAKAKLKAKAKKKAGASAEDNSKDSANVLGQGMAKADSNPFGDDSEEQDDQQPQDLGGADSGAEDEEEELSDREKMRIAKEELRTRDREKKEALQDFISNCGYLADRPFESRRWDFDAFLRAIVRDTLTYDQIGTEIINDQKEDPHHFVPVDGSTLRLTTPEFSRYSNQDLSSGYDILYPEKELEALKEDSDAFVLDQEKLAENDYKYVQVVRGRIERAFTADELAVGMRNPTTDIYANGYSISELELLVGAVSSHIFTENYNNSYYTQGFSAKGILHIKAPMNRRKIETVRLQWQHMMKGSRNSFQTPIFAGMDEVQWIPLTQNHSDMEFSNWMNYLIKIICSIYQIDPAEIGFGMKEEGGGGGSLGGDNTKEKLENSKNKGLKPLLRFIESYINKHLLSRIDDDFVIEFCGLADESPSASVDRESKEVKFKKTINEIREDNGLPPIPGADDLILDPTYFQWFSQFHPEGKKVAAQNQAMQQDQPGGPEGEGGDPTSEPAEGDDLSFDGPPPSPGMAKALRKSQKVKRTPIVIEYYTKD